MKKRKGFTLIELLGVIVILGIVLGIVSIAYINISKSIKLSYYKTLEESILIEGGEYFAYNEDSQPKMFGDTKTISVQELVNNKYITNVIDRDGNTCDLNESYVGAYKNSYDKTNYYVCLKCENDDYISDACDPQINYGLEMTATIKNSNQIYQDNTWTNKDIVLNFKTSNDISEITIEKNGTFFANCNLYENNNLKTCNIDINSSGTYTAYGEANGNKTSKKTIEIKIDKTSPQFNIYNDSNTEINNKTILIPYENNNITINDKVKDIIDNESGIKRIRYSFEKENNDSNFKDINSTVDNFDISKDDLTVGKYKLLVQITDNANNITEKYVIYEIYNQLNKLTSNNCENLVYNGLEQTLVKPITGIDLSNNKGIDAKNYQVVAKLKENYRWEDGTNDDIKFTCEIKKSPTAEVPTCNTNLTYNGEYQNLIEDFSGVNIESDNSLEKNAGNYDILVSVDPNYTFSDGSTSTTLTCSIGKIDLTVTPINNQSKNYGDSDPTLTYSYSGNVSGETPKFSGVLSRESGENVGSYQITKGTLALTNNETFLTNNYNLVFSSNPVYFEIMSSGNLSATLSQSNYEYDGTAKKPSVTVKYGNTTLTLNTDYTVSYEDNIEPGTATVTITGKGNYSGTISKTFTISRRKITITAKAQTITYGNSINKTVSYITYDTLASNHSITNITLTPSTSDVTTNGTITPSNVKIMSGSLNVTSKYSFVYKSGTLVIDPSPTAEVPTCNTNLTYNGEYQNLIEDFSGVNIESDNSLEKNAGNYDILVTAVPNYTFSDGSTSTTLTCSIGKIDLTVTPINNQSKNYGDSDPTLTYSYSGNVSGETPKFSGVLSRESGENVGSYQITKGTLALTNNETFLTNNYNLVFSSNTVYFEINKTNATNPTLIAYNGTYDGNSHTITVSGGSGGTIQYSTDNKTWSTSKPTSINAGTTTVYVRILGDSNHNTTSSVSSTIKISQKALTITAKDQSLNGVTTIDKSLSQITSSGLLSGHSITSITLNQSTTSDTTNGTITPSEAVIESSSNDETNNYDITYESGSLSISTKEYCMIFNKNGASQIGGVSDDSITICCKPGSSNSCNITTPTITPITNYDVLGWNASNTSTTSKYSVNSTISLTEEEDELFAITRSSEASRKTNYITFKLNGATSFTYNETKYTSDTKTSCNSDYGYNGEAIPDSCTIKLPTITRSGGTVYGWAEDNNSLTADYSVGSSFTVYDEITLNAITSRKIQLTIDANGGTTTIGTLTNEAYNQETGAGFIIPSYNNANMCRTATNYTNFSKGDFSATGYLLGYKYIGLTNTSNSKTVKYCQGNYVFLENNTTLYAVWNEDYAKTLVTSGDDLYLREGCGTDYSIKGDPMSGSTTIYVKEEGSKYASGYMGYWIKYGSRSGCASSMYLRKFNYYPKENSCSRTDYVCNGGTAADVTMTPSVLTLNLKNTTSGTINIDNRCGSITSTTSSNTNLVKVSRSGDVITATAVAGSVAENQQKTASVTVSTEFGCMASTDVIVKNTLAVAPEVTISTSSTIYENAYYKKGATFQVTCSSPIVPITDFTVSGATITGDDYEKTATITYNTTGDKTLTATCTNQEGTTTESKTIKIRVYSSSSACGCAKRSCTCTCKYTVASGLCTGTSTKYTSTTASNCNNACENKCSNSLGSSYCGHNYSGSCSSYNTCWHS